MFHWQVKLSEVWEKDGFPSSTQTSHFANGANILLFQPLFDAIGVEIMPAIQRPNVIASDILFLP